MANREVFPSSLFPLKGDVSAGAGATSATVVGIQTIPVASTTPTDQNVLQYSLATGGYAPSIPTLSVAVNQVAHGFSTQQVVYFNGTVWALAQADASSTLGLAVVAVVDVDNFIAYLAGQVTGLSGLTAGQYYFVSDSVAGSLTTTEPTAQTSYSNPLLFALSATSGIVLPFRPSKIAAPIKYSTTIGDGVNTTYTVNHNLGTTDLMAQVIQLTGSLSFAYPQINIVDANNIQVIFTSAPALNSYRVVIEV